jgi:hypothetical protein
MWNRLAFVLNRLPHARSRYVVVVAQFAERIPQHSTQQSEQIADPQSLHFATAGLPQRTYVAVTGYTRFDRTGS